MMENELVKIWQSSPNLERVKFEKSRLMIDVQYTVDHLHKKIKYRDLTEQIAIVLGIPVFAYYTYSIPFTLTKIASVLIIFWGIYVFIRLRNAKKHKPGSFTLPYLEYLYKTREYILIQKQLVDNILYWYILPAMALMFLFILGPGITGRVLKIMKTGLGIVAVGVAIYFLNKRAVKKQFIPRLVKIDELINVMEKSV
jgi:hypothetical protein